MNEAARLRSSVAPDQEGVAVIAVLLWTTLVAALASAIILVTTVETAI